MSPESNQFRWSFQNWKIYSDFNTHWRHQFPHQFERRMIECKLNYSDSNYICIFSGPTWTKANSTQFHSIICPIYGAPWRDWPFEVRWWSCSGRTNPTRRNYGHGWFGTKDNIHRSRESSKWMLKIRWELLEDILMRLAIMPFNFAGIRRNSLDQKF